MPRRLTEAATRVGPCICQRCISRGPGSNQSHIDRSVVHTRSRGGDRSPALTGEAAFTASAALVSADQGADRTQARTMRAAGALNAGLVERVALDGLLSVAA